MAGPKRSRIKSGKKTDQSGSGPIAMGQVPDRATLLRFLQEQPGRVSSREVARAFGLKGNARLELKSLMRDLAEEGAVAGNRRHAKAYIRTDRLPPVGIVDIIERDTDGELLGRLNQVQRESDDGPPPRPNVLILPGKGGEVPGVGDRVLAHLNLADDGRVHARVIRKLGQSAHRILGVFEVHDREIRVVPVDRKARGYLVIGPDDTLDAKPGELVMVELLSERGFGAKRARVRQRLVDVRSPKAVSLIAIHAHGIPVDFSPETLAEAERAKPVQLDGAREDLTGLPLITIDPEDARDHDDAVFAHGDDDPENPGGHIIWVAIADVAHYVTPGSALDRDALQRGNSVYLPDRVVPMLPEKLSTDLCSLKDGVRRPCLAVRMVFNAQGKKLRHKFTRGIMQCAAGVHYAQVQRAIDGQPDQQTEPLMETVLKPLYAAYAALARAREARAPLDLDLPERKVEISAEGKITAIRMRERLESHRLIEEMMIQANVAAAETLEKTRTACLYRVHETPTLEKLEALKTFLKTLDLKFGAGEVIRPQAFNKLLAQVKDSPHREMINELVLRSQTQAYYGPERLGHFGLALVSYAHFTSPIRRYADLLVHRGLIRALHLGDDGLTGNEAAELEQIGEMISQHERRAMAAERDSNDRYMAAYMSDRIGATFSARISGVTRFGLFVSLVESGADGLIPISSLGDEFFRHDAARHALIGGRQVYRLGERVEVKLEEAAPLTGGLRFSIVKGEKPARERRRLKRQSAT
jgi:ribonuclease R